MRAIVDTLARLFAARSIIDIPLRGIYLYTPLRFYGTFIRGTFAAATYRAFSLSLSLCPLFFLQIAAAPADSINFAAGKQMNSNTRVLFANIADVISKCVYLDGAS